MMILSILLFLSSCGCEIIAAVALMLPDYRIEANGSDPSDVRVFGGACGIFGLFLAVCGLYIWNHP